MFDHNLVKVGWSLQEVSALSNLKESFEFIVVFGLEDYGQEWAHQLCIRVDEELGMVANQLESKFGFVQSERFL